MIDALQSSGDQSVLIDVASAEAHTLRAAWAAAWLREYRCYSRYLALLAVDAVEETELRFAWLDWWDATCVCRDALQRLEGSPLAG
ncbi:MAG TPA: hypothetical protein VIY90_13325 [Steroidobacteraceae bacterium]